MFVNYSFFILSSSPPLRHKPFEQEGKEVGEGIEFAIEANVLVSQLDAVVDVGVFFFFQQVVQRGRCPIVGFHLYGDKGLGIADKEVHLKSGLVTAVVISFFLAFRS